MKRFAFVLALLGLTTACAPTAAVTPEAPPPIVSVYTSPAVEPWLEDVYACAGQVSVVLQLSASPEADLQLRLGAPVALLRPAYAIGTEDILIVTRHDSPLHNLTAAEARALFSQGQEAVSLWVFTSGADVQEIFEREVMLGSRIHPSAQLGLHPAAVLEALNNESAAVGILPRRWKGEALRELFALTEIPVLAITPTEPRGAVKDLLACLQAD